MRNMKESGIDWIGKIPENWKIGKVKDIFIRKNEKANDENPTVLSLARSGVKIRDISTGEGQLAESYNNYNPVEIGDLLLNPMDLYSGANCSVSKVKGVISPAYINLKAKGKNNSTYYDYFFKTQYWGMVLFAHGKGVSFDNRWTLGLDTALNYFIPIPSETEQDKIANYLDIKISEIDNIIEKTKETIEDYKKIKKATITEAVTKGIHNKIKLINSGHIYIGEIPNNWHCQPFKSFADIISKGTTPKEMEMIKSEIYNIRYLKSENIVNNILVEKPEFYITEEVHNGELNRSQLKENDLLFVIAGASIGKVAIMNKELLPANTNQAVCFIRINKEYQDYKEYLWYFLQSDVIETFIKMYSVQAAQPNISMENLGNIKISIPNRKEDIKQIIDYLDIKCQEIDKLIENKEKIIEELEQYKKSLIYEYVTGKKEVV